LAEDAWLTCLVDAPLSRPLLIQDLQFEGTPWYYMFGIIAHKICVFWPLTEFKQAGPPEEHQVPMFELDLSDASEPRFVPILDLERFRVRRCEVLSPSGQVVDRKETELSDPQKLAGCRITSITKASQQVLAGLYRMEKWRKPIASASRGASAGWRWPTKMLSGRS
jgi:hypothetical protein